MIKLKKFYISDITKKYLRWLKNKELIKYTTIVSTSKIHQIKKYIKSHKNNKNENLLRIFYKKKHIGNIKIHFFNNNTASIGILIGEKQFHSKGIGTKSIKLAIKIIKKRRIGKILAYIHNKNYSSIKAFEKNGFKRSENKIKYILNLNYNK